MFDDDIDSVLRWARQVDLTDVYFEQRRTTFMRDIHAGAVASLPRHSDPLGQLMSDIGQLQRMGTLADGSDPWQVWRANVLRWAEMAGKIAAPAFDSPPSSSAPVDAPAPTPAVDKVRILFLEANVVAKAPVNCEDERRRIQTLVESTTERDRFHIDSWPKISFAEVPSRLLRDRPRVMHFSGHGKRDGALVMHRGIGDAYVEVAPQRLVKALRIAGTSLRLIVLNACFSEALAKKLVEAMDVVVVGMNRLVQDQTAIRFGKVFYGFLFDGLSIRDALELTRTVIDEPEHPDADAPQLVARPGSTLPDMKLWD